MFTKTLAAIVVGCSALGVGTVALAAGSPEHHRGHAVQLVPKTPAVDARSSYGILRRSATKADRLPAGLRARAAQAQGPIDPRLVAQQAAIRLYARQTTDGQVCLTYYDGTSGLSANTCTSTQQAVDGDLPPEITMVGPSENVVYALIPDGVGKVTAIDAAGAQRDIPVQSNAVVVSGGPSTLEWTTPDGRQHALGGLAGHLPGM